MKATKPEDIKNENEDIYYKNNLIINQQFFWNKNKNFRSDLKSYQSINNILVYYIIISQIRKILIFQQYYDTKFLIHLIEYSKLQKTELFLLMCINNTVLVRNDKPTITFLEFTSLLFKNYTHFYYNVKPLDKKSYFFD